MLITIPENTWKPWKPVMKKKKSAKIVFPYSFTFKLAPSTTNLPFANSAAPFSFDKTVFSLVSKLINSVRIKTSGFAAYDA